MRYSGEVLRHVALGALLGLPSCTAGPSAAPPPAVATPRALTLPAPVAERPLPAPPRQPPPNRCLAHGLAAAPPEPEVHEATMCSDDRKRERAVAATLIHRYEHRITGSVVDVSFGCDPITSTLQELVLETGGGHGGSLTLWRIYRDKDESSDAPFHVVGISHFEPWEPYDHYTWKVADRFSAKVTHATLSARVVQRAIDAARPALTAELRELEPPPLPNGIRSMHSSFSSGDFHDYVRIRDGAGHVIERDFSGYPGTSEQRRYLGLQLAMESLEPLVDKISFDGDDRASDADRAFFVRQMLDARERLDEEFAWWVRERYVRLAGRVGTSALVPLLLDELRDALKRANALKPEERKERLSSILADPILALVQLSGWDARFDENGAERPMDDVAKDYLNECSRPPTP